MLIKLKVRVWYSMVSSYELVYINLTHNKIFEIY